MIEVYFEILKELLDVMSFSDFIKKQMSLSSSCIDIGRSLSWISLDL